MGQIWPMGCSLLISALEQWLPKLCGCTPRTVHLPNNICAFVNFLYTSNCTNTKIKYRRKKIDIETLISLCSFKWSSFATTWVHTPP